MDEPFTGVGCDHPGSHTGFAGSFAPAKGNSSHMTHDLNLAASRFDAVLLLNRRLIAFGEPKAVFTPGNLSQALAPNY